jgi:hypothetical protein
MRLIALEISELSKTVRRGMGLSFFASLDELKGHLPTS